MVKTATVSDLGEPFASISRWLDAGETVEVMKDGAVYAKIVPADRPATMEAQHPPPIDFAQRAKELFRGVMVREEDIHAVLNDPREGL